MKKLCLILILVSLVTLISVISHAEATSYDHKIQALQIDDVSKKQTSPYQVCAKKEHKIPIKLTNNGDVPNKYYLSVKGKYASIPGDYVLVKKDETKKFFLDYIPSEKGEYGVIIKSETHYGDDQQKIRLPIKVENCYDVSIDLPSEIRVNSSQLSFPVKNVGTKKAELKLALEKNEYVELKDKELTIIDEEKIKFNVLTTDHTGVERLKLYTNVNGIIESHNLKFVFGEPFLYEYRSYISVGIALVVIIFSLFYFLSKKQTKTKPKVPKKAPKKTPKKQTQMKVKKESRPVKRVKREFQRKTGKDFLTPFIIGIMVLIIISVVSLISYLYLPLQSLWNEVLNFAADNLIYFYIGVIVLLIILIYLLLKGPKKTHYMSEI